MPEPINPIPLHKTEQMPCHAMDIKESTMDGNLQVLENLLKQGGLGETVKDKGRDDERPNEQMDIKSGGEGMDIDAVVTDDTASDQSDDTMEGSDIWDGAAIAWDGKEFDKESDKVVDISDYILLIHGDLLTKEHIATVKKSRHIEDTPKWHIQYAVTQPGLFHYEMACAEAIWQTWIQPVAGWKDSNSMYQHAGILRPNDTGKLVSKPGFQCMHHLIQHDIWASMIDCWASEAQAQDPANTSLEAFVKSKPLWNIIVKMSNTIMQTYVGTPTKVAKL